MVLMRTTVMDSMYGYYLLTVHSVGRMLVHPPAVCVGYLLSASTAAEHPTLPLRLSGS
jgi:hypothetical protein